MKLLSMRCHSLVRSATVILFLGASQVACIVDRSGFWRAELVSTPSHICPEDPITVTWEIPTRQPCWTGRPSAGLLQCSTINSPNSSNPETPFAPPIYQRSGSISYDPGPTENTEFSATALILARGIVRYEMSSSVNVINVPASVSTVANGLCGDNAQIALGQIFSSCVEVNQICISSSNPSDGQYILSGWRKCIPGTSPDSCSRPAFRSEPLAAGDCIAPASVSLSSFQGLLFLDLDWRDDPVNPDPRRPNCQIEGSGYNPDLEVIFQTSCTNAYSGCGN